MKIFTDRIRRLNNNRRRLEMEINGISNGVRIRRFLDIDMGDLTMTNSLENATNMGLVSEATIDAAGKRAFRVPISAKIGKIGDIGVKIGAMTL